MFRHKGKSRTVRHNLGIASLLSFVAGMVNVVGFLSVQKLTTNVTGHFAYMVEEALVLHFPQAFFYLLYIFAFFVGSFSANLMIELANKLTDKYIYLIPIYTESMLLAAIGLLSYNFIQSNPNLIACTLLFSMGLQNALVTIISNSVVRTTHLTGLFTDLGIELSKLLFRIPQERKSKLISSIKLRLTIISTFFIGGIMAGLLFEKIQMKTLLFASFILVVGLLLDYMIVIIKLNILRKHNY